MLKNFFLTYANYSFKDNPDNLYKIYDAIIAETDEKSDFLTLGAQIQTKAIDRITKKRHNHFEGLQNFKKTTIFT